MSTVVATLSAQVAGTDMPTAPNPTPPASSGLATATNQVKELPTITVTGSHIPRTADSVGPMPVQFISADEIERLAPRTVGELLARQPLANFGGILGNNESINGNGGSTAVSLRGLRRNRTLILINGRRVSPNFGGTTAAVDLNTLPPSAIERVEILKDGASAIYGADAVAGVVNIILKSHVNGGEANIGYGNTTDTDMAEFKGNILWGIDTETTSFLSSFDFYHRNALFNRDRDYAKNVDQRALGGQDNRSPTGNPGLFMVPATALGLPGANLVVVTPPPGTDGTAPPSEFVRVDDRGNPLRIGTPMYNFAADSGSIPEQERRSFYTALEQQLFKDQLQAFADFNYSQLDYLAEVAPAPLTFAGNSIPVGTQRTFPNGVTIDGTQVIIPASNPWNPFGVPIGNTIVNSNATSAGTVLNQARYRFTEAGNRITDVRHETVRAVGGLRGRIGESSWRWETATLYDSADSDADVRHLSISAVQRALNDPNPATALNVFTSNAHNVNNPATIEGLRTIAHYETARRILAQDLRLDGQVFDLAAGAVALAVGGEFRDETYETGANEVALRGDLVGTSGAFVPDQGSRNSEAAYAEVALPVFSPLNAKPGLHGLEFQLAGRFENYSDFGSTAVPKFAVKWQPLDESLTLRGSWGLGFRAPSLAELFQTPFINLTRRIDDPFRPGNAAFEVRTTVGGNRQLEPEESESWNFGAVWTPAWKPLRGLNVGFDAWQVTTSDRIGTLRAETYLNAQKKVPGAFPDVFERGPEDGIGEAGPIVHFRNVFQNLGEEQVQGFDFTLSYSLPLHSAGKLTLSSETTYLNSYEFTEIEGSAPEQLAGRSRTTDAIPQWRSLISLFHDYKWLTTGLTVNYIGAVDDVENAPTAHGSIGDYITYDLQATARLNRKLSFTLGCLNVTDATPPLTRGFTDGATYFINLYNPMGRFVYANFKIKF